MFLFMFPLAVMSLLLSTTHCLSTPSVVHFNYLLYSLYSHNVVLPLYVIWHFIYGVTHVNITNVLCLQCIEELQRENNWWYCSRHSTSHPLHPPPLWWYLSYLLLYTDISPLWMRHVLNLFSPLDLSSVIPLSSIFGKFGNWCHLYVTFSLHFHTLPPVMPLIKFNSEWVIKM